MKDVSSPQASQRAHAGQTHGSVSYTTPWRSIASQLQLSERELDVVRCIIAGHKELTVALMLGISRHTVRAHVKRVYHKLEIGDRLGLATRVFECHLAVIAGKSDRDCQRELTAD